MEIMDALAGMSLFQDIGLSDRAKLVQDAFVKKYAQGEFVFHQGTRTKYFHVVCSGVIKLFRSLADGREQTVYLVERGEPFCLCSLYGAEMPPVSALAMTACKVVLFSVERVEEQMSSSPLLLLNIVRLLNTRLMYSYQMIEDLGIRSIHQRVASFLLHGIHDVQHGAQRVTLSVSRQEVAKILGTTPESISRIFARMSQDGLIAAQGRKITVLDPSGLRSMAG